MSQMIQRYFSGLRYRWVFVLVSLFFFVDLIVPDALPFADEVLLGLLTLLLGSWRKRKETTVDDRSNGKTQNLEDEGRRPDSA